MEKCYTVTYWTFNRDSNSMESGISKVFKKAEDAMKYVSDSLDLELDTVEAGFEYGEGAYSDDTITFLIEEHIIE